MLGGRPRGVRSREVGVLAACERVRGEERHWSSESVMLWVGLEV